MRSKRFDANRTAVLGLLAMLHDPDVEIADLEHEIALDVGLSFRLLRYINSAFVGLHDRVSSIGQAVSVLGLDRLKQWASLVVFTSSDATPSGLTVTALARARFCELAGQSDLAANGSEMFTLGLFSVIDARFDTPMGELLSELPLAPDMCDALLEHEGRKGQMLECLDALENGDFDKAEGILPSAGELYISALAWADEITEPLFGRGEAPGTRLALAGAQRPGHVQDPSRSSAAHRQLGRDQTANASGACSCRSPGEGFGALPTRPEGGWRAKALSSPDPVWQTHAQLEPAAVEYIGAI